MLEITANERTLVIVVLLMQPINKIMSRLSFYIKQFKLGNCIKRLRNQEFFKSK